MAAGGAFDYAQCYHAQCCSVLLHSLTACSGHEANLLTY